MKFGIEIVDICQLPDITGLLIEGHTHARTHAHSHGFIWPVSVYNMSFVVQNIHKKQ